MGCDKGYAEDLSLYGVLWRDMVVLSQEMLLDKWKEDCLLYRKDGFLYTIAEKQRSECMYEIVRMTVLFPECCREAARLLAR